MKTENLTFKVSQQTNLPPHIRSVVEKAQDAKSQHLEVVVNDSHTYLIIALGERPHGGYSVEVDKIEQKQDGLHVYVNEKPPEKGAMAIQVISHPYTVVFVEGIYLKTAIHLHMNSAD